MDPEAGSLSLSCLTPSPHHKKAQSKRSRRETNSSELGLPGLTNELCSLSLREGSYELLFVIKLQLDEKRTEQRVGDHADPPLCEA